MLLLNRAIIWVSRVSSVNSTIDCKAAKSSEMCLEDQDLHTFFKYSQT